MRSFKHHLQEKLTNPEFAQAYEEEFRLASLAVQIAKRRDGQGLTQDELATKAHLTQQQISKVEHAGVAGFNVNTLFRVCEALGLEVKLQPKKRSPPVSTKKMGAKRRTVGA